jgi:hypothetical protein
MKQQDRMMSLSPTSLPRYFPAIFGLTSALAVLVVGNFRLLSLLMAPLMLIAGVVSGLHFAKRKAPPSQAVIDFLASQIHLGDQVVPVWCNYIESSRSQMEVAINALSERFGGIVDKLDVSLHTAGQEAYSMAMVLADCMQTTPWEILGTDISTRELEWARRALYSMERGRHIPQDYLRRYCRKGSSADQLLRQVDQAMYQAKLADIPLADKPL